MTTLIDATRSGRIGTRNSAMPGTSFALPVSKCGVGSKLAQVMGSVCHDCYAMKSERMYPSVRKGWQYNYEQAIALLATDEGLERWAQAMAFQIAWHCHRLGEPYHRWYDAGDLPSVRMLMAVARVCELTPSISHWLPTREASLVKAWRKSGGAEPDNLVIRISATMIGDAPVKHASHTSTVHAKGTFDATIYGNECPKAARKHATNSCESCRNCWDKAIGNVSYQHHR